MTIITLTTDFGLADGYVGIMKGVILGIAPGARLVDLSHDVAPQNVRQAAYVLGRALPYFPAGSIHLAVVDPGVGSERRALAVQGGGCFFVGPDNGLFSAALALPGARAFVLDRRDYWLADVSRTFHGRDIFAPVAAHLAHGEPIEALGSPIMDALELPLPQAVRHGAARIEGEVVYVDGFGNLITNIPGDWLGPGEAQGETWRCFIAGETIPHLSTAYAGHAPGALLALVSSGGTLEVAVRDGSAAARLGVGVGERVLLASDT